MSEDRSPHILLGVSGSVAAFKAASIASELTKHGVTVRVVLTEAGERFVTAETFRDLTNQPVVTSMWNSDVDHIDLAKWADLLVVAPATANVIARAAVGLADDLLSTLLLAADSPVVFVPAMETHMWEHLATQRNVERLKVRGVEFIGPAEGRLASGDAGLGRMVEPEAVVDTVMRRLSGESRDGTLEGIRILVTAGPTQEPIDPVRFISNRSSGKMGFAIARVAYEQAADVTLITGPVDSSLKLSLPTGIRRIDVATAHEMLDAVRARVPSTDVLIMAAAVADFRPALVRQQKIKKAHGLDAVTLEPTEDILAALEGVGPNLVKIGFAAETESVETHAQEKLVKKRLAMVVANDVGGSGDGVFGSDSNTITLIRPDAPPERLPRMSKADAAARILEQLPLLLKGRPSS